NQLSVQWQKGRMKTPTSSAAVWRDLRRLSWVFCKASQHYRMRLSNEEGEFYRDSTRLQEYENLTREFAAFVRHLQSEMKALSVAAPHKIWEEIVHVAERATVRSKAATKMGQDLRLVLGVLRRLPGEGRFASAKHKRQ